MLFLQLDYDAKDSSYNRIKSLVNEELKQYFRPEFLNRLDEIIVFRQLTKSRSRRLLTSCSRRSSSASRRRRHRPAGQEHNPSACVPFYLCTLLQYTLCTVVQYTTMRPQEGH